LPYAYDFLERIQFSFFYVETGFGGFTISRVPFSIKPGKHAQKPELFNKWVK
jgi:hypothetical protein